jgi:predicted transcriptional regulator with HTH domain
METLLEISRSLRRSNARREVLLALDALGMAYVSQLAERTRIAADRVHAVLHGDGRGFRVSLSLTHLELVEAQPNPEGHVYGITPRGRLVVKSLQRGGLRWLVDGPVFLDAEVPARAHTGEATGVASRADSPAAARAAADAFTAPGHSSCPQCGAEIR